MLLLYFGRFTSSLRHSACAVSILSTVCSDQSRHACPRCHRKSNQVTSTKYPHFWGNVLRLHMCWNHVKSLQLIFRTLTLAFPSSQLSVWLMLTLAALSLHKYRYAAYAWPCTWLTHSGSHLALSIKVIVASWHDHLVGCRVGEPNKPGAPPTISAVARALAIFIVGSSETMVDSSFLAFSLNDLDYEFLWGSFFFNKIHLVLNCSSSAHLIVLLIHITIMLFMTCEGKFNLVSF